MEYVLADNDELLYELIGKWNELDRIAVDFEGEFNLHIYGEHLCLIQVYDGNSFYIIDPRSRRVSAEALRSFFSSPARKLWFDMQSDNSLVHKNYGAVLNNVTDVRVMAMTLGYMGNLTGLEEKYLCVRSEISSKKKLQQTNWLRRPLSDEQVAYALSDVEYLFQLEDCLLPLLEEQKLMGDFDAHMKKAAQVAAEKPAWTRICNWKQLSKEQKSAVKEYFIARDVVAKRFNVPAYQVLDKHRIAEAGKRCPKSEEELFRILGPLPPRFSSYLQQTMRTAFGRLHAE